MKAIVLDEIGAPLDVLKLRDVDIPTPQKGEVLVQMLASSINPGDFLFVQNLYPEPKRPVLPSQIAGNHGVGCIEKVGAGVTGYEPGMLVAFSYLNTWAEFAAVPQEWLIPLPKDYPLALGAQVMNVISAWDMLEQARVQPGDWMAVTAGYSTVASMVTHMAQARGIRTISVVRKKRLSQEAPWMQATNFVVTEDPSINVKTEIERITERKGLHAAIDCVGGKVLPDLVRNLNVGGRVVVYGGFDNGTFELHNFDLLLRVASIESYCYRYLLASPRPEHAEELQRIVAQSMTPGFPSPIGGWHRLDDYKEAVRLSIERPETGKRIFVMQDSAVQ